MRGKKKINFKVKIFTYSVLMWIQSEADYRRGSKEESYGKRKVNRDRLVLLTIIFTFLHFLYFVTFSFQSFATGVDRLLSFSSVL